MTKIEALFNTRHGRRFSNLLSFFNKKHLNPPILIVLTEKKIYVVRRGRDSNPGRSFPLNTLAVCCFQPLSHLSNFHMFSNNHPQSLYTSTHSVRGATKSELKTLEAPRAHRKSVSLPNTLWQGENPTPVRNTATRYIPLHKGKKYATLATVVSFLSMSFWRNLPIYRETF